jgi:dipeptidase D
VKCPGGHSGLEIHRGIPNALKIAVDYISMLSEEDDINIAHIGGGLARNAIPPEAKIVFTAGSHSLDSLINKGKKLLDDAGIQDSCEILIKTVESQAKIISGDISEKIINLLKDLPHGVLKMNPDTGSVLSSINLAVMEIKDAKAVIQMNTRSSDSGEKDEAFKIVKEVCDKYDGCTAEKGDAYPGWRPDINSDLLKVATDKFNELRGNEPEYLDIHAGLECGIIMDKFPSVKEAISIGPNIRNAHSIKEKLEISTTVEIWEIVNSLIKHYSK